VNIAIEMQLGAKASLDVNGSGPTQLRVMLEGSAPAAPRPSALEQPVEMMAKPSEPPMAVDVEPAAMELPARSMMAPWQARPILLRVAVLDATGGTELAAQAAVMLMDVRRISLERKIGMRLEIVNMSRAPGGARSRSVVYYREGFLRAALALAEILPGEQKLEPMPQERAGRKGIDVEIWLGKDKS